MTGNLLNSKKKHYYLLPCAQFTIPQKYIGHFLIKIGIVDKYLTLKERLKTVNKGKTIFKEAVLKYF